MLFGTTAISSFYFDLYQVPSNSMVPALKPDCILLTSKKFQESTQSFGLFAGAIKKGDILVFQKPDWSKDKGDKNIFVKRCIGLPGDTVEFHHSDGSIPYTPMEGVRPVMLLFPQDTLFIDWTLKDYGPFIVPKKNLTIELTPYNFRLYKKLLSFENKKVSVENGKILINCVQKNSYTFKKDYYFMLGDNFLMSEDSRYWGCVPDSNLLGKVIWHS